MHDLEAIAHEFIEGKILGKGESLIGYLEDLHPVLEENPHFAENFLLLKKLNPTSSSEMGSIQVSKPCNLLATQSGNG